MLSAVVGLRGNIGLLDGPDEAPQVLLDISALDVPETGAMEFACSLAGAFAPSCRGTAGLDVA